MASFASNLDTFNEYISPVNVGLQMQVMGAIDERFNKNQSDIDNTLASLHQQENLLIRQPDKELFAAKTQSIINQINAHGKMDWSRAGTTRAIKSELNGILGDPYMMDQIANSQSIRNTYTQVDEIRKKTPDLYSSVNFQDALKLAGVDKYLSDQNVTSIGSIDYKSYINAPKVLDESISKWAKDYGYHTVIDQGNTGNLIFTNSKREVLTRAEIVSKIESSLDPKLADQLGIDTRYRYQNATPEEIQSDVHGYYNKQNAYIDSKIANIKAQRNNAPEAEQKQLDADLYVLQDKRLTNQQNIDRKTFNYDNEKYNVYSGNLFDSIAENYDRNDVVDVKYIDSNLQLAKYKSDLEYKAATLDQGQQRIDISKRQADAADLANNIALGGSITDIPDPTVGKKSNTQIAKEIDAKNYATLTATLQQTDKAFQGLKTDQERQDYITTYVTNPAALNINTDKTDPAARAALEEYKASSQAVYKSKVAINDAVGNSLQTTYNNLVGSPAKLNNLALTMPLTAGFLKAGKGFESLDRKQKIQVLHEMAASTLQEGGLNDEQLETIKTYTKNLEDQRTSDGKMLFSTEERNNMKDNATKKDGIFYNTLASGLNLAQGIGRFTLAGINELPGAFSNSNATISGLLSGDRDSGEKTQKELVTNAMTNVGRAAQLQGQNNAFIRTINPFREDSDISELERDDLNSGATESAIAGVRTAINAATQVSKTEAAKIVPSGGNIRGVSFSPENKHQKAVVTEISTQLSAKNAPSLAKGQVYTTRLGSDGNIQVTYVPELTDAKGKKVNGAPTTQTILPESIPALTAALTAGGLSSYNNSRKNINATPRPISFHSPANAEARFDLIQNIKSQYGESIPDPSILGNPGSKIYTKEELRSFTTNQPEDKKQQIYQIVDAMYTVNWKSNGRAWVGYIYDQNNQTLDTVEIPKDYDEGEMKVNTMVIISAAKAAQIQKLIKQ